MCLVSISDCENSFAIVVNFSRSCRAMQAIPNYKIESKDYWVVDGGCLEFWGCYMSFSRIENDYDTGCNVGLTVAILIGL